MARESLLSEPRHLRHDTTQLCLMGAESLERDSSVGWRLRRFQWYEAKGGLTPLIRVGRKWTGRSN